jgi:hypothetical protein
VVPRDLYDLKVVRQKYRGKRLLKLSPEAREARRGRFPGKHTPSPPEPMSLRSAGP